ncbi:MAG: hypothetical protein EHM48_00810 [Planctomycetaceae bacterium]|nr:MAG: hypothetical protein EHM48_00810 [Planctomycetaceae bacterium]
MEEPKQHQEQNQEQEQNCNDKKRRFIHALGRFVMWWVGIFALLGGGSVCPCCGQPTCAGGAASAGLLGGLIAAILTLPKWIRSRLCGK